MIKLLAKDRATGNDILILGLSHGNITRLQDDKTIEVTKQQLLGKPFDAVMIFYGDSEEEMVGWLKKAGMLPADLPVYGHTEEDHQR